MAYDKTVRIHVGGYIPYSHQYGPGRRAVVVLQGNQGSPYRYAPEYDNPQGGMELPISEVLSWFDQYGHAAQGRLSVAGGEPLDQVEAVTELAKALKELYPEGHTVVYTAHQFTDAKKVAKDLFKHIDVIAGGPFDPTDSCTSNYSILYSNNQYWAKLGKKVELLTAKDANGVPTDIEKNHLL